MAALGPPKIHSLVRLGGDFASLKRAFDRTVRVTWAKVPNREVQSFLLQLSRQSLLSLPKFKPVQPLNAGYRKVYLANSLGAVDVELGQEDVTFTYDNWTMDQILDALGLDAPSSFETAGHLVRLNLPEDVGDEDARLIGTVILDKLPHVRTVVRKEHAIESVFRVLPIRLIAGEDDYVVTAKESDCVFTFDYRQVYWNSRLQHEHHRLVSRFELHSTVVDMFCGVGPFAIPAVRNRRCRVLANDLNPESVRWLRRNIVLNRAPVLGADSTCGIEVFNTDARRLIEDLSQTRQDLKVDHVIMNLPASAVAFLDGFPARGFENACMHCYLFVRAGEEPESLVRRGLRPGCQMVQESVHFVRNVAPNKDMYCVSFKTQAVAESGFHGGADGAADGIGGDDSGGAGGSDGANDVPTATKRPRLLDPKPTAQPGKASEAAAWHKI